jgi:hypothetical protein
VKLRIYDRNGRRFDTELTVLSPSATIHGFTQFFHSITVDILEGATLFFYRRSASGWHLIR